MFSAMSAKTRTLTEREIAALPQGFVSAFDAASVLFLDRTHNPLARNKIVCRGNKLYWPNHPQDFTRMPLIIQSLLVHELCHVWQYETGRLTALRYLTDPRNWVYSYRMRPGAKFDDYPTEKQADLLQDWFLVNRGEDPIRFDDKGPLPTKDWLNNIVPFDPDTR